MSLLNPIDLNVRPAKSNRHKAGPGRPRPQAGRYRPGVEPLEQRELLAVSVFQQGFPVRVNNVNTGAAYAATQDTELFALVPDFAGDLQVVQVAGPADAFLGQVQGLIRFDNLFGTGANQIPIGARINAAALIVGVPAASGNNVFLHRMLVTWNEGSTWTSLGNGVQTNNVEALATPESSLNPAQGLGPRSFSVTDSLQVWSNTTQPNTSNLGWLLTMPTGNVTWEFDSSEFTGPTTPMLAVDWTAPTPGTLNFSLPTYSVTEGTANATITVRRSNGAVGAVSVSYAVTAGSATAGQDFTAATGTLNFAANVFSQTFNVPITNDTLTEPSETINLTLSNPTGGSVLGTQTTAVLTIVDNDAPPSLQFGAANYPVNEGVGNATVTVSRSGISTGAVSVQYEAARGSATPGQDFTAVTGTLSWAAGDTANKTFTVAIINDTLREPTERLNLILRNPTGGAGLGSQSTATLTITDNEPPLTFREGVGGYTGTQDTELGSVVPTTVQGNATAVSVDLDDGGGPTQGLLRFENLFGPGPNQIPLGSTIAQATLTFNVVNTTVAATRISIYRMLVNWTEDSTWSTFGGNGIQTNNVEAASTEDGFLTNSTAGGTVSIPLTATGALQAWSNGAPNLGWVFLSNNGDGWDFSSSEDGTVNLRPQLAVTFVPPQPGYISLSAANYSVEETGGNVAVTVNREFGSVGAVSVSYAASNGTATAGEDYDSIAGTLTFAAGEASRTFTIPILNDALVEGNETILLTLSNPTGGASLGDITDGVVTIIDNDGPGSLQLSPATFTVNENGGAALLTISRTGGNEFQGTVTVDYVLTGGTAVLGQDLTGATGTVTFNPGEISKTFSIPIVDDSLDELTETAIITLSNATGGATLGSQTSATLSIDDNERSLVIQDGLNGYAGTQDATLRAATPDTADGGGATVLVDLDDALGQVQGLLRFDNLFGTGRNQIPANATVLGATLTVQVTDGTGGAIALQRMLVNWTENSTWNSLNNGVQVVTEAALVPDSPATIVGGTGLRSFDVSSSLQAWLTSANPNASNLGWLIVNTTNDSWAFQSSEFGTGLLRPRLEVVFTAPASTTTLRVTSSSGGANGFTLGFNQPFDPGTLNVFGSPANLPDVSLVGPTGPVAGSVVVNPTNSGVSSAFNGVLSFVPSGGPLAPGTYTATLRSAADGFKNLYGNLQLDGNGDGTAGDNYTTTFTVAAPAATARVVSLPNFLRGPNQVVGLPTGIPLTLSEGLGVTRVAAQIRYDPALLTITGGTVGGGLTGATVTVVTTTPGLAVVTFTRTTALAAGAVEFARLTATVPANAPYSAKHVLDLLNVTINTGTPTVPAVDDDGLHIVSYLGDLNGNGAYDSADASLVDGYLAGTDAGFAAYQLGDPRLVADITQDGLVNADDATAAAQLAAGTAVVNVPARPATPASPIAGGPDPRLYIPTGLTGAVGQTVTVPVLLEVTDPAGASVRGVDVALRYDASRFAIGNARLGELLAGFGLAVNAETPGELRLVAFTGRGPELAFGAAGALFLLDVTVLPGAATGASALNLVATLDGTTTALYGNDLRPLTLLPAPTDGADDPGDGVFTVTAAVQAAISQNDLARQAAALAVLLSATDESVATQLGGNVGAAPATDTRDAFFQSYGSDSASRADSVTVPLAFHSGSVQGRTGDAAVEGPEGSDGSNWFDVNAFFGILGDQG